MIPIKNEREIDAMRQACKITAAARALAGEMVRPGVTTRQIDKAVHDFIVSQGAKPSFLNYAGFPASACISVNETVIHGIPDHRVLKEGDIVSVDVGAYYKGFHVDCAATFACGEISPQARKLIEVTKQSFFEGLKFAKQGCRISDIGHAVQSHCEAAGYGVVREFVGHGIGREMHEDPMIPNYGRRGNGALLKNGMCIAIEPMITMGSREVMLQPDRWTVCTRDGSVAAHFEHTIAIHGGKPDILSSFDEIEQ